MRVSTLLVASSRIRIAGSARNARAIVSSCFCPSRQVARLFVDRRVVVLGQRPDEVVRLRRLRRLHDRSSLRVLAAVGDVLANRAGEQPRVLQHHAEHAPQRAALQLADVDAVHANRAAVDVVEPHQQVDERRLAGAGRTDDRDHLPGRDVERHVVDERHRRPCS